MAGLWAQEEVVKLRSEVKALRPPGGQEAGPDPGVLAGHGAAGRHSCARWSPRVPVRPEEAAASRDRSGRRDGRPRAPGPGSSLTRREKGPQETGSQLKQ